jgi:hypothetical protein
MEYLHNEMKKREQKLRQSKTYNSLDEWRFQGVPRSLELNNINFPNAYDFDYGDLGRIIRRSDICYWKE